MEFNITSPMFYKRYFVVAYCGSLEMILTFDLLRVNV